MAQIHLNQIALYSPINHLLNSWTHPRDEQADGIASTAYWKGLGRTLERGLFDGIFFADSIAMPDESEKEAIAGMRRGANFPKMDPLSLVPLIADATTHLGFAVTLSITAVPPFVAVRQLGTIDNLTGGRFAWNVVTGHSKADFKALGIERPAHDDRYDRADEYLEICYRLWDGFPHDAVLADKRSGTFVDPDKIRKVDYDGKYYRCHAYPVVSSSRQGRPLIYQAGQSGRGMQFGVTHGDAIYAVQPLVEQMKAHMTQVRDAAQRFRPGSAPRVFFGIQPILGGTQEEAERRRRELCDTIPIDLAILRFSALVGVDLSGHDLDAPFVQSTTQGNRGLMAALAQGTRGRAPTIREAAMHYGVSAGMPQFAGTPGQVADWIEGLWRETGCYGFGISANINPLSMEEFVDHVVPILQKRGLLRRAFAGRTFRENLLQQEG